MSPRTFFVYFVDGILDNPLLHTIAPKFYSFLASNLNVSSCFRWKPDDYVWGNRKQPQPLDLVVTRLSIVPFTPSQWRHYSYISKSILPFVVEEKLFLPSSFIHHLITHLGGCFLHIQSYYTFYLRKRCLTKWFAKHRQEVKWL